MVPTLAVFLVAAAPPAAQDRVENLPPPTPVVAAPAPVVVFAVPQWHRANRDAWQNYAVDHTGHFRARVIATSHGAYYYYNGQPYLTPTVHPHYYQPFVIGN